MGKQYDALTEPLQAFIAAQKVFFVGTATADSRVNISPKGMDTLRETFTRLSAVAVPTKKTFCAAMNACKGSVSASSCFPMGA